MQHTRGGTKCVWGGSSKERVAPAGMCGRLDGRGMTHLEGGGEERQAPELSTHTAYMGDVPQLGK